MNFNKQKKHWPSGRVKMTTVHSFAMDVEENDTLMLWDVKSDYMFLIHYLSVPD